MEVFEAVEAMAAIKATVVTGAAATSGISAWYTPPYWYGGGGCHWKKRPFRVRVRDGYYGWHFRTVWRPVRVCY